LDIKLIQYREKIPRKYKLKKADDHIATASVVFKCLKKEYILVAAAKRESGEYDLYYEG
jgi:hypothetical protein